MKQPKRPPMVAKLKARLSLNPNINLIDMNIPRSSSQPTPKLKDILESEVDSKYYLSNQIVEKIISETDFKQRLVSITLEKSET